MQDAFANLRILILVARQNGGQIDLPNVEIDALAGGSYQGEQALALLQARSAVSIDGYGEDGVEGQWWLTAGRSLFECITEEIDNISSLYGHSIISLEEEKSRTNSLVGFDLSSIRASANKINDDLGIVAAKIEQSPTLQPMQPIISDIAQHFITIRSVLNNFEDIYRGVISPIQAEGKSGIKHTVFWAIVGIGISTAVSIGLTFWTR